MCINLDIQRLPQSFHQQAYSLIPHWIKVFMDGLTSEHLLPGYLELHIRITCSYQ